MFQYQMSARKQGLGIMATFVVLFGIPAYFFTPMFTEMIKERTILIGSLTVAVPLGFLTLIGIIGVGVGLLRLITGGEWRIEISEEEIIWGTPLIAEKAFRLKLSELANIQRLMKYREREDGRKSVKTKYFLILHNGTRYKLNTQSGIDEEVFVDCLSEKGFEVIEKKIKG